MTSRHSPHLRPVPLLASIVLFSLILVSLVSCGLGQTPTPTPATPSLTYTSSYTPTEAPTQTPYIITATGQATAALTAPPALFFLSLADSPHYHIFAYSPTDLPLTRLTYGAWDDVSPALSPDGTRLVFSSNRNGYWNFYILDLRSGETSTLTDSPDYKGNPSWSQPDGAFITYESLVNGNLEILVRSTTDLSMVPLPVAQDLAADFLPAWSPQGREIAFVSNRSGNPEIWLANLDIAGNSINISQNPDGVESHPAWSPDGNKLAWASTDLASGLTGVFTWDIRSPDTAPQWVGAGDWPVWQTGDRIASRLTSPNQTYLTAYTTSSGLSLPPVLLPGSLKGLAYGNTSIPFPGAFQNTAVISPSPLYTTEPNPQPGDVPGRSSLAPLNIDPLPNAKLHELADDSFQALRLQVAGITGWDALSSLENAYIPLTTSLDPGLGEDWLYTGRAFTLNPALVQANWMEVVREDFGQQTYWRIYLRTTAQDGSQGEPLLQAPWDFSARSGDASAYENGGRIMTFIPAGYWVDLTSLALQYGWERLPALTNWRTYYSGARFNELAYTEGLDWRSAMFQLYPPEALITPTVVIPPTRTPTRVPPFYRSPTPTLTPTHRPTNTP
jgi:TolB protein